MLGPLSKAQPRRESLRLAEQRISEWESSNNFQLPDDFREFVARWNGGYLFGMDIVPLEQSLYMRAGLLAFHNWGNGDFDCLDPSAGKDSGVVFANHENGQTTQVAPSFRDWLARAIEEKKTRGVLLHPMDYAISNPGFRGLYAHIVDS